MSSYPKFSFPNSSRFGDVVDARACGAIADGASHPLASRYASLSAAQSDYPFVTALTQQIDWAACQLASNIAFGMSGSENYGSIHLNKSIHIPHGIYYFGSDTWKISRLKSGRIFGDGKLATKLTGTRTVFQTDGCWYSSFENMAFVTSNTPPWRAGSNVTLGDIIIETSADGFTKQTFEATKSGTTGSSLPVWPTDGSPISDGTVTWIEKFYATFDLDGNVDQSGASNGVQANTFFNILIAAGDLAYGLAICRVGNSGGAAQGSENTFFNLHAQSAAWASYYQNGFNALDNCIFGGDFKLHRKYGIYAGAGTVLVEGVSFECQYGYMQVLNDGWDVALGLSGAHYGCSLINCRSESLRFAYNSGAVKTAIIGCAGTASVSAWAASHIYATNFGIIPTGTGRLFAATTGGQSGATEPAWPTDGSSISDGTVTWQEVAFNFILNRDGTLDHSTCKSSAGTIKSSASYGRKTSPACKTANYTLVDADGVVIFDATNGPITLKIPNLDHLTDLGRVLTVVKADTSENAVTIQNTDTTAGQLFADTGTNEFVIPGGSILSKTFVLGQQPGGTTPPRWYTI